LVAEPIFENTVSKSNVSRENESVAVLSVKKVSFLHALERMINPIIKNVKKAFFDVIL
jgi:hypothetical protein